MKIEHSKETTSRVGQCWCSSRGESLEECNGRKNKFCCFKMMLKILGLKYVTTSVCAVYVQLVCWEEFSITMNEIRGYMFYKRKLTIKSKKINNERAHFPCFLSCGQLKKLRERLGTAIMTIKKKE